MEFNTIEDALNYYKLGRLEGMNDTIHAYGVTDEKKRVWLPTIPENDNHTNVFYVEGREYIFQIDEIKSSKDPDMEIVRVITREGTQNNTIDYHDNGKYQQILYDRKNNFSVFVKVKVYKEQNEKDKKDVLYWNAAFFSSADEARKKAEELHKIAKQQSRVQ